jgi:hypothetical protein
MEKDIKIEVEMKAVRVLNKKEKPKNEKDNK